jgi:DNA-binding CsgD family transcriptional regulator
MASSYLGTIEFNITGDGSTVLISSDRSLREFTEHDMDITKNILEIIEVRYPETFKRLKKRYGHLNNWRYMAVKRFIKCNWGNDDEIKDITAEGELNFELVRCPLRGECKEEGIICCPTEERRITKRETEILKYLVKGYSSEEMADKLCLSIHTINNHRVNLRRKLNAKNNVGLIAYAHKHNIK